MSTDNHKKLALALNNYFEFNTYKRFLDLWHALERSMEELEIDPLGWGDGWAMREAHRREAEKVWGKQQKRK